ncbi:MAG: leucine-rich repeat domain-containing protein [Treponema sp.]|nr:leucine-rich repeat domain-containing protein [Treponema sp.]
MKTRFFLPALLCFFSMISFSCDDPGFTKITFTSSVNAEARIENYGGTDGVCLYYSALPFWLKVPETVMGYKVLRVMLADADDKTDLYVADFPEGVLVIDSLAGCTNLTEITFPKSLVVFPLFTGCTTIEKITVPENVNTILNSTFSGCTALTSVTLPDNVKFLETKAFSECTGITTFNTGNGLTGIGSNVFSGATAIKTLYLGESIKEISAGAFEESTSINSVTCLAVEPPEIEKSSFYSKTTSTGSSENTETDYTFIFELKVPAASLDKYQQHKVWCKAASISSL